MAGRDPPPTRIYFVGHRFVPIAQCGELGINLLARRNSVTNSSKVAGSSMLQAWPGLGKTLCTAPGINDAVFFPPASELSYSALTTIVCTFIAPSRGVMSSTLRGGN